MIANVKEVNNNNNNNENFVKTSQKLLKNRNWIFTVVRYFIWKL